MVALAVSLGALPLPEPFAEAGITLHAPKARIGGGVAWFPFPAAMGQGLPQVGGRVGLIGSVSPLGNGGMAVSICYGRPNKSGLWLSFEAGATLGISWAEPKVHAILSPHTALRLGYSYVALRASAFISRSSAFANDFYAVTVEVRSWL